MTKANQAKRARAWKRLAARYRKALLGFADTMNIIGPIANAIIKHENYVSCPIGTVDGRRIIFTVQVVDGMTPAEHVAVLQERLEKVVRQAAVARLGGAEGRLPR